MEISRFSTEVLHRTRAGTTRGPRLPGRSSPEG
jgi:hypothetical protein